MSRMRTAAVDAALSGYWQQLVKERRRFELGLVVGQIAASSGTSDALLTAIPVPSESESEDVLRFEDISSDWVQEFAKQIDRLLPGGIDVVGVYVVSADASRSVFDQTAFYLRAVAEALALPEDFKDICGGAQQQQSVHYVVHICPNTNKTSAKSIFDILDASKSDAIPAELKTVPSASLALKKFAASIAFSEPIAFFPAESVVVESILDEFQQQLQPLAQRVQNAVGIVKKTRSSGNGDAASGGQQVVQFLSHAATTPPAVFPALANESNAEEVAIAFLKRDFLKSLLLRVELILEKWSDDAAPPSEIDPFVFRDGGAIPFPKRCSIAWRSSLGECGHFPALLHIFQEEAGGGRGNDEQEFAVQNALEILGGSDSDARVTFLESDSQQQKKSLNASPSKAVKGNASSKETGTAEATTAGTNGALIAVLCVLLAILAQKLLL